MIFLRYNKYGNLIESETNDTITKNSYRVNNLFLTFDELTTNLATTTQDYTCYVTFTKNDGSKIHDLSAYASMYIKDGVAYFGYTFLIADKRITSVAGQLKVTARLIESNPDHAEVVVVEQMLHVEDNGTATTLSDDISGIDKEALQETINKLNQPIVVLPENAGRTAIELLDFISANIDRNGLYVDKALTKFISYSSEDTTSNAHVIGFDGITDETGVYVFNTITQGYQKASDGADKIGLLEQLTTEEKNTLVSALNELNYSKANLEKDNVFTGTNEFKDIKINRVPLITNSNIKFQLLVRAIGGTYVNEISPDFLLSTLQEATQDKKGLLSKEDKKKLDTLYAILGEEGDADTLVNTITEVLKVFENYNEGLNLAQELSNKVSQSVYNQKVQELTTDINSRVEKVPGKELSTNDFTDEDKKLLESVKRGGQAAGYDLSVLERKVAVRTLAQYDDFTSCYIIDNLKPGDDGNPFAPFVVFEQRMKEELAKKGYDQNSITLTIKDASKLKIDVSSLVIGSKYTLEQLQQIYSTFGSISFNDQTRSVRGLTNYLCNSIVFNNYSYDNLIQPKNYLIKLGDRYILFEDFDEDLDGVVRQINVRTRASLEGYGKESRFTQIDSQESYLNWDDRSKGDPSKYVMESGFKAMTSYINWKVDENAKHIAALEGEVVHELTKSGTYSSIDTSEEKKLPYAVLNKLGGMSYKVVSENSFSANKYTNKYSAISIFEDNGIYINSDTEAYCYINLISDGGVYIDTIYSSNSLGKKQHAFNCLNEYAEYYLAFGFAGVADATYKVRNIMKVGVVNTISFDYEHNDGKAYIKNIMINEGTTAKPYTPYFDTHMNHNLITSVMVKGANLFDEKMELGGIIWDNGNTYNASDRIRSVNFTRVEGNTTYRVVGNVGLIEYDMNLNFVRSNSMISNTTFTTNENTRFIKLVYIGTTYNNDIAIYKGTTKTTYEPYHEREYFKGILEEIDNRCGERGYGIGFGINNDCYNYIDFEKGKAIIKCGKVGMASLTYGLNSGSYPSNSFYTSSLSNKIKGDGLVLTSIDTSHFFVDSSGNVIMFTKQAFDSEASLLNALSNVDLVYELATPKVIDISDILNQEMFFKLDDSIELINLYQNPDHNEVPVSLTYQVKGDI